jgi:uncharacterized membrane protein
MLGAFPAVQEEIKNAKKTPLRIALFCAGIAFPVILGCISAFAGASGEGVDVFSTVSVGQVIGALFVGAFMAITQIVPGLSASALLMAIGWFSGILDSASISYWQANPQIFLVYGALGVGVLAGLFGTSKLLTLLFSRARDMAYFGIVGLSLGSVLSMFCNGDIMEVYLSWANGTAKYMTLDIVLGVVFFAIGVFVAYLLVRYQRKKDQESKNEQAKLQARA